MSALRSSASKADVRIESSLRYDFAKLKAKGQLRSLYRTQYAKPVDGPTTTVSTVQTFAGHLVSELYAPTPIGGKRVGVQADPRRSAQKLQRRDSPHRAASSLARSTTHEGMKGLGSIDSVEKRLQKVEYTLPRLDGQVELLMKMQLAGTTSYPQAQAPSGPREKGPDMAYGSQLKTLGVWTTCAGD
uniref:Uncharacterized protein n=1 Tax=Hyaloperonospora arabidopsidis (strain Emoy2) TaxID=559515 RepID=M4BZD2_HYAAE